MRYPALDIRGADPELVLAVVDDFGPTAVEELPEGISVYFATAARRDEARTALAHSLPASSLAVRDVDDEDWARRSQQNLTPITVGDITVTPPWHATGDRANPADSSDGRRVQRHVTIVISPSMGFGTGHHATTRLCLAALQLADVTGRSVLDVGTGSGVLAMAAVRLGAREAIGIDLDPDAIHNAHENLALNPDVHRVRFEIADLRERVGQAVDIVIANLTGAVLVQNASRLLAAARPGGTVIVSGLQTHERHEVISAFDTAALTHSEEESGWLALAFNRPTAARV